MTVTPEMLYIFIILTIMHPIADFGTPIRKWGNGTLKQFFASEWFLALNPLHALWDAYSPLRRHQNYIGTVYDFILGEDSTETTKVTWWFWR